MQLEGSSIARAANDRFDATMTNVVTWSDPPETAARSKQLASDAQIQVPTCRLFQNKLNQLDGLLLCASSFSYYYFAAADLPIIHHHSTFGTFCKEKDLQP